MPNWKKVIVSGSDAILNKVTIPGNSGATTFTTNADTLIFSGSAYFTGSVNITGSLQATSITGSLLGTSSYADYALTASYALNGGGGGGGSVFSYHQTASAVTWSISHNLNTYTPIIQVYDDSYNQIIPASISGSSVNTVQITFSTAETGYAVLTTGGNVNISGSNATLVQSTPATTWSFAHGLNEKYPVFTIFDNNDDVIVPLKIHADNANTASIYFTTARTGTAVAANCGLSGSTFTSASYALTASYVANASSFPYTGSAKITGSLELTGSFNVTGSTTQIGNNTLLGNTTLSGSVTISGSANANANFTLQGHLRLDPGQDPGPNNYTASYLFTSASNTATGYDLYYRQDGNLTKFKWIEGMLNTGVLYGGVLSYSGSYFYLTSGSGIIVNHNAITSSEINPIVTYVNWNATTQSIVDTGSQNTYVYIDATGSLKQQTSFFTSEQYHEVIPIGRVSHYGANSSTITGVGNNMVTAYDQTTQLDEFVRAFGPLKINGLTITPQPGSLHINIGSGTSFNLGGYYQYSPDLPSIYNSSTYLTSSIIRIYRSGSGYNFDNNGGSYYTTVNPTQWDNGSGTLQTVGNSNWSIQRVFINPVSGRSHIYYAQSTYATYLDAIGAVSTDDFEESEVTKNAYVFAGYLVMEGGAGNTNLAVSGSVNAIIQAGLFRNSVGGSGGAGAAVINLDDLADVSITSPSNGQALIYSSGLWINGTPISASYATTSSYALTATSASYALQALSSSYASNADLLDGKDSTIFATTGSNTFKGNQTISSSNAELLLTGGGSYGTVNFHNFNASIFDYVGQYHLRLQSNNQISNKTNNFVVLDSNDNVKVNITGSLIELSGSVSALNGFTGSFLGPLDGTASYAQTASYVNASNVYGTGSFSGSLSGSASGNLKYVGTWNGTMYGYYLVNDVVKYGGATYVVNSNVYGNTPPDQDGSFTLLTAGFPYTGSAQMTGSLGITGSASISGSLLITGSNSFLAVDEIYSGDGIIGPTNRILTKNNNLGWGEIGDVVIYSSINDVYVHSPGGDVRLNAGGGTNIIQVTGSLVLGTGATGSFTGSFSGSYTGSLSGTSSYADYATSASYALTASYLNPITSGYIVLTQVSQSLNFADDTSAAAGGVPLGGLYRNGNFIAIRIV